MFSAIFQKAMQKQSFKYVWDEKEQEIWNSGKENQR